MVQLCIKVILLPTVCDMLMVNTGSLPYTVGMFNFKGLNFCGWLP